MIYMKILDWKCYKIKDNDFFLKLVKNTMYVEPTILMVFICADVVTNR